MYFNTLSYRQTENKYNLTLYQNFVRSTLGKELLYKHPYFNQKGFFMVIGITALSRGSHYLKIQMNSEFPLDKLGSHILKRKQGEGQTTMFTASAFEEISDDDYSISIPFYNNKK